MTRLDDLPVGPATMHELQRCYESLMCDGELAVAAASGRLLNSWLGYQRYDPAQVYLIDATGIVTLIED